MEMGTKGYEEGRQDGAREMIEKIVADVMTGLEALDGDIQEAKPEKLDFYLGYQRGLKFSIIHIQRIAADTGIYLLTTKG